MTESELIDIETINSLKAVLEDGILELFSEFIADGPKALGRIEVAVNNRDIAEIDKAAHYLKGSAGNIGAIALSNACRTLEIQAKNNEIVNAEQQLVRIKQLYQGTIQFMQSQGN